MVVLASALLVATPFALRALPAADSDITARGLLDQVRSSQDHGWSGYVETEGTLQLPDADGFSDLGTLFGDVTRMRAWWQDADHWRVDRLLMSGEKDLIHDGDLTTEWDYEDAEAEVSRDPDIRLPRTADLLPPELGRRLLRGVSATDVSRIPARRVAGMSAPGLRVVPSSRLSSIDHVDLWADPDSGVPLLVEVYGAGRTAAFTSEFRDFSPRRPADDTVDFSPTPGTDVDFDDVIDIADAANQYAPLRPPRKIAGLAKSPVSDGAVGVYGTGMTQVIVIPLRDSEADALRDQLAVTPGVKQGLTGTFVSVGPLGVLLTGGEGVAGWLLAGTLTRDALDRAGDDLAGGFVFVEDDDR